MNTIVILIGVGLVTLGCAWLAGKTKSRGFRTFLAVAGVVCGTVGVVTGLFLMSEERETLYKVVWGVYAAGIVVGSILVYHEGRDPGPKT